MDWTRIGNEVVELTRAYLRINTTNPPGNEMEGARFLSRVLDEGAWRRIHGNDERISVENLTAGVRCYTEMLLDMAAA